MNVICLSGRLCHTPELRKSTSGKFVCTFSIAVDRPRQRDTVDFFSIIAWEGSAEYVARAGKGDMCIVNGVLCTRRYTDKQGVHREVVEIKADELTIVRKNTDT